MNPSAKTVDHQLDAFKTGLLINVADFIKEIQEKKYLLTQVHGL